jgi:hypothetical protein
VEEEGENVCCVLRGGGFYNDPTLVRCAVRYVLNPGDLRLGFRVVVRP